MTSTGTPGPNARQHTGGHSPALPAPREIPGRRHPLAARIVHWPEEARDYYEERAAIVEADTGRPREEAERNAEYLTRRWWASLPPV